MHRPHFRRPRASRLFTLIASAAGLLSAFPAVADGDAPAAATGTARNELPLVEVVATTPLPGTGIALDKVPANVQVLTGSQAFENGDGTLTDALQSHAGSVSLADTQGNPNQVDLNYRGFTASPVLGTAQGISVFVDGVRVNEVFGDVVNWDLIPRNAIASITLIPGTQPQFGLNTLGGAVSVTTKSGFTFSGTQVSLGGGSFRSRGLSVETGGHGENVDWYLDLEGNRDPGWAMHNPSEVNQAFGKVGWQDGGNDIDLSFTWANNHFDGNAVVPQSFSDHLGLAYSWPDRSTNHLGAVQLRASHEIDTGRVLSVNLYLRHTETDVFNSNMNGLLGSYGSYYIGGTDARGNPLVAGAQTCVGTTPYLPDCPDGSNVADTIDQHTAGLGVQLTDDTPLFGRGNHFGVGLTLDRGTTGFSQAGQEALLTADNGTPSSPMPWVPDIAVAGLSQASGLYATDTLDLLPDVALTASARYNRVRVKTQYEYYNPDNYTSAPDNGDYTYSRLDPSLGLAWHAAPQLTLFGSYGEGMRAPTPVELSCADPNNPCGLPNALASDPYLRKVVSRTLEFGARGKLAELASWDLALFRTRLQDDILFVGGTNINNGYFTNVGATQRQGLELGGHLHQDAWRADASASWLRATFETPFQEFSSASSAAAPVTGLVTVPSGAHMPGIPARTLRAALHYVAASQWSAGVSMLAQSPTWARMDEANNDVNGQVPGFAVFNLDARARVRSDLELELDVRNLFDRRYSNFGTLSTNNLDLPGHQYDYLGGGTNEQFRSISPPRTFWVALRWRLDTLEGGAKEGGGTAAD